MKLAEHLSYIYSFSASYNYRNRLFNFDRRRLR